MPGQDMARGTDAWAQRRRRIDELFSEAAELPTESRPAFLTEACGDDAALRFEVESLLAYDPGTEDSISGLIEQAAAALFDSDLPEGTRIGPYRVLEELGRGGMGAVYLAVRDDDAYQKRVAIKLVKRGMDTDAVIGRFRQERQVLATLEHPYIAKLLDGGTAPDGRPYFVMEFVQGLSITSYSKACHLGVQARCELFRKVCEAVSYAHRGLVVHRDLKPGNILVSSDGAPKLLDFGIAKLLTADPHSSLTEVSGANPRMATIDYASPEQLRGLPVTTSADVYSLGVILYELLTGAAPFAGKSGAEKERAICEDEPRPASAMTRIDPDLDNIIAVALRKEPERRYRSVDELSEDIRRHFAGLPVAARGDGVSYRTGKFLRRHRIGVAAAAIALGGLLTGAVVAIREAHVADAQRARAERRLHDLVELANRTLFDMNDSLERVPGATETRRQLIKSTLDYLGGIGKDAGGDPGFQNALASAYLRIGDIQGAPNRPNLGDTAGALESYRRALQLYQAAAGDGPANAEGVRRLVDTETNIGRLLNSMGRSSEAQAELGKAIAAGERGQAQFGKQEALTLALASAYNASAEGNLYAHSAEAVALSGKAIALLEPLAAAHKDDRSLLDDLAGCYESTGIAYHNLGGHLPEALAAYQKSLKISERLAEQNPNDVMLQKGLMHAYANVGDILADPFKDNLGDPVGAAAYYQKMVAIAERAAAADERNMEARYDLAQALLRYGYSMTAAPQREASVATLRRAVTIAQEAHRGDPANLRFWRVIGIAYARLGARLNENGEKAEALEAFRAGRGVAQAILAADANDAPSYTVLFELDRATAVVEAEMGDRKAIATMENCVAWAAARAQRPTAGVRDQLLLARSHAALGHVYETLAHMHNTRADWQQAHDAFADALRGWDQLAGKPGAPDYTSEIKSAKSQMTECERHTAETKR